MKGAKSVLHNKKGSVLVLVTVSMVALLGFVAVAIDGGYLYFKKTRLQDIADSSALAAAAAMVEFQSPNKLAKRTAAFDSAVRFAERNGLEIDELSAERSQGLAGEETYVARFMTGDETGYVRVTISKDNDSITVEISLEAKTFFARMLDEEQAEVDVASGVIIGQASKQSGNLAPLAFFWGDYQPYTWYNLTLSPGSGVSGNYGFLDYGPSCDFDRYLSNGYSGTISVGQTIETYPGEKTGQVRHAIEERIARCMDSCYVGYEGGEVVVHVKPDCPRIVVIPVVDGFFEQNGRGYVTVRGFARFFIENYDDKTKILSGWVLQGLSHSEPILGGPEFTVQSVRLVK